MDIAGWLSRRVRLGGTSIVLRWGFMGIASRWVPRDYFRERLGGGGSTGKCQVGWLIFCRPKTRVNAISEFAIGSAMEIAHIAAKLAVRTEIGSRDPERSWSYTTSTRLAFHMRTGFLLNWKEELGNAPPRSLLR